MRANPRWSSGLIRSRPDETFFFNRRNDCDGASSLANQKQDMSGRIGFALALSVLRSKRFNAIGARQRKFEEGLGSAKKVAKPKFTAEISDLRPIIGPLISKFDSIILGVGENIRRVIVSNTFARVIKRGDGDCYFSSLEKVENISGAVGRNLCDFELFDLLENLFMLQLRYRHKDLKEIYLILLCNDLAAGYTYGFQKACFHIHRGNAPKGDRVRSRLIRENYARMFGERLGRIVYTSTLRRKRNHQFQIGSQSGHENFADYDAEGAPQFGLQRIISFGFDASMVERTLNDPLRQGRLQLQADKTV